MFFSEEQPSQLHIPEQLYKVKRDKHEMDVQIKLLQNRIQQLQSQEQLQQKQIRNKKDKIGKL
jgi:hypothetical protein